jgi:pimeloyl-ACP methyl ester carboxylesterase
MSSLLELPSGPVSVVISEPAVHKGDAILVHGYTGSKEDFDYLTPFFTSQGFRIIAADNRGAHQSPHSQREGAYTIASMANDVVEIAEALELKRPHLLGHSLGGVIAQYAVTQSPSTFASLTLMCSGPDGMPTPNIPAKIAALLGGRTAAEVWASDIASMYSTHPRRELMESRWLASDMRALELLGAEITNFASVVAAIAATGVPSHVLYGEHDDAWPTSTQDQMAQDLLAALTVVADAGHCPNEDQPERTAEAIYRFWQEHSVK